MSDRNDRTSSEIQVGDEVEVIGYEGYNGRRGYVDHINDCYSDKPYKMATLRFHGGESQWCFQTKFLRLVDAAVHPDDECRPVACVPSSPQVQVGDIIEVINEGHLDYGKSGVVTEVHWDIDCVDYNIPGVRGDRIAEVESVRIVSSAPQPPPFAVGQEVWVRGTYIRTNGNHALVDIGKNDLHWVEASSLRHPTTTNGEDGR